MVVLPASVSEHTQLGVGSAVCAPQISDWIVVRIRVETDGKIGFLLEIAQEPNQLLIIVNSSFLVGFGQLAHSKEDGGAHDMSDTVGCKHRIRT